MPPRWRCRFCLHEEIHGGGRRSRLPVVQKRLPVLLREEIRGGPGAAGFPLFKRLPVLLCGERYAAAAGAGQGPALLHNSSIGGRSELRCCKDDAGSACAKTSRRRAAAGFPLSKRRWFCLREEIHGGRCRSKLPLLKKEEKMKKKQRKNRRGGEIYAARRRAGREPSLPARNSHAGSMGRPATEAPRLGGRRRRDPEQPPRVQRLPYRPDPARPPAGSAAANAALRTAVCGAGRKNSGAANWVEKLDWKTPSGAPYTSAPEQGGPSNRVELIMAQRGGGGGGFSPGAGAGRGDAPAPGTGAGGGFFAGHGRGARLYPEPGARGLRLWGCWKARGFYRGKSYTALTEGAADVWTFSRPERKGEQLSVQRFIKRQHNGPDFRASTAAPRRRSTGFLPDVITLDPVQKLLDYYKELGGGARSPRRTDKP